MMTLPVITARTMPVVARAFEITPIVARPSRPVPLPFHADDQGRIRFHGGSGRSISAAGKGGAAEQQAGCQCDSPHSVQASDTHRHLLSCVPPPVFSIWEGRAVAAKGMAITSRHIMGTGARTPLLRQLPTWQGIGLSGEPHAAIPCALQARKGAVQTRVLADCDAAGWSRALLLAGYENRKIILDMLPALC